MDFRGGTYIDQYFANSINEGIKTWALNLNTKEIQYVGTKTKEYLICELPEYLSEFPPLQIDKTKNVWTFDSYFKTGTANIHIIKTEKTNINTIIKPIETPNI